MCESKETLFNTAQKLDCNVIACSFTSSDNFHLKLGAKIASGSTPSDNNAACRSFIDAFSKETSSNWILAKTKPQLKRYIHRVIYHCQFSSTNKGKYISKHAGAVSTPATVTHCSESSNDSDADSAASEDFIPTKSKKFRERNRHCTAKICITMHHITRDTKKKHKHLSLGYNSTVEISFEHNHRNNVAEAQSYRRMSKETKSAYLGYFHNGMSTAEAHSYHSLHLMDTAEDDVALNTVLADASVNPSKRQVEHVYSTWRKSHFGERSNSSIASALQDKKEIYEKMGIDVNIQEDPLVITIITPIMKRAHTLEFSGEICFVDSSGSCDQSSTCVTFMFGGSKVGGVPLACVLHTSQSENNYTQAFQAIKDALGDKAFFGKGAPGVFMTDDSVAERNALRKVFGDDPSLLLCIFHLNQALWRWLWDSKHSIQKDDRKHLMKAFQNIVYALSEEDCMQQYDNCINSEVCQKYSGFLSHVADIWNRRREWALCYRQNLITRGHNTNNYVESSIRIFKDVILQRSKAYNSCSLVDFITNIYEKYHKRRLLEFANSRTTQNERSYHKYVQRSLDMVVTQREASEFTVISKTSHYTVDSDLAHCDCPSGQGGAFCKHLAAVQEKFGIVVKTAPAITYDDRIEIAYLAMGGSVHRNKEFFLGMDLSQGVSAVTDGVEMHISDDEDNDDNSMQQQETIRVDIESDIPTDIEHESVVNQLESHFARVITHARNCQSSGDKVIIKKIKECFDRAQTDTQLLSLFANINGSQPSRKRTIGVQPTARSRRKHRPGLTCGAKRIQAGRPSNIELGRVSKRAHKLGTSVEANHPNAKSHGKGH